MPPHSSVTIKVLYSLLTRNGGYRRIQRACVLKLRTKKPLDAGVDETCFSAYLTVSARDTNKLYLNITRGGLRRGETNWQGRRVG